MGLLPWHASRLSPAEAQALYAGQQRRFNREAAVTAWFMSLLGPVVASAVHSGIARAFGEKGRVKPIALEQLLQSIPGYEEAE